MNGPSVAVDSGAGDAGVVWVFSPNDFIGQFLEDSSGDSVVDVLVESGYQFDVLHGVGCLGLVWESLLVHFGKDFGFADEQRASVHVGDAIQIVVEHRFWVPSFGEGSAKSFGVRGKLWERGRVSSQSQELRVRDAVEGTLWVIGSVVNERICRRVLAVRVRVDQVGRLIYADDEVKHRGFSGGTVGFVLNGRSGNGLEEFVNHGLGTVTGHDDEDVVDVSFEANEPIRGVFDGRPREVVNEAVGEKYRDAHAHGGAGDLVEEAPVFQGYKRIGEYPL